MPHRQSLVRRVAELRRAYTGETDSSLMPAAVAACQSLDSEQRVELARALDRDYSQRLLGDDSAPPMAPALRSAVLPDAGTYAQRELEAAVLLAASRAGSYLRPGTTCWLKNRPSRLIRMVRPQPDGELVLHLETAVLAPLMLELWPRLSKDGVVAGLPGLRATVHRRHVELIRLSTDRVARIQLANVSYRAWSAALTFAETVDPEPNPLQWLGNDPAPLLPQELEALSDRPLTADFAGLASWLLRRFELLAVAQNLRVDAPRHDQLQLCWSGEPTAAAVASKLVHPITGLPGDRFLVVPNNKHVTIRCLDVDVSVELRPVPRDEFHLVPPVVDVASAWRAWDQRICAPGQWSEHLWARPGGTSASRPIGGSAG